MGGQPTAQGSADSNLVLSPIRVRSKSAGRVLRQVVGYPEVTILHVRCGRYGVSGTSIDQRGANEASMRQGKRLKLNGRGSGFRASEILGILEGTCRVVLFQVSAVDGIP